MAGDADRIPAAVRIRPGPAAPRAGAMRDTGGMQSDSRQVFVIEDDGLQREAISLLVGAPGWEVRTFPNAAECLAALAHERADCIVADLYMPGMNGADFIEVLMARGIDIPVVVITGGGGDSPLARRALDAGARMVLTKSGPMGQLVEAVHRALTSGRGPQRSS